jgi:serine protease Do
MIDDIKGKRSSAAERKVSTRKPSSAWRTVLLVLGALAALGVLCLIAFPKLRRDVRDLLDDRGRSTGTGAYLGMAVQDLTGSMAKTMGLESASGVVVTSVAHSSPADEGGLKTGDIVLRFDHTTVRNVAELEKLVAAAVPGDTYSIVVNRRDQERTLYVELTQRPTYLMQTAMSSQTELDSQWGCTLSPLTPALIEQLSLPASITGVAVVAVEPTGLSKSAGMLPGDVIVSVNREPTPDLASFYRAIEDQQNLVLEVYRSGKATPGCPEATRS